jgi:hypothetical protein
LALQLHDDLAFEHVDERMGVVPMDVISARQHSYLRQKVYAIPGVAQGL